MFLSTSLFLFLCCSTLSTLLQLWSVDGTMLKIIHTGGVFINSNCVFSVDGNLIASGVDESTVKV